MCTHLSKEPLARYLPSGLKATLYTGSWCFVKVWMQIPRSTSHNLTVESKDALTGRRKRYNFINNEIFPGPPPMDNIQPFLRASHKFLLGSRLDWEKVSRNQPTLRKGSVRASPGPELENINS